jgi:uncharacterized membrane protein YsdA (DUF1294 family)
MPTLIWIALACYTTFSLAAVVAYSLDKRAAQAGGWRVRERTLHIIALLGGWPGAFVAQRLFRHKTRDTGFLVVFWLIGAVHASAWGLGLWLAFGRAP